MALTPNLDLLEEDDWIGGRIALTAWILLSITIYLLGVFVPWEAWLILGILLAPMYAGQLVLPVVYAFVTVESPVLAILASLIYLGIFLCIVGLTGWWSEPETTGAAWPVFLPLGSALLAAVAFAPFYALAAIWSDFYFPMSWSKRAELPKESPSLESASQSDGRIHLGVTSKASRRARYLKRIAAIISILASILTIIGFLLQFLI